MAKKQQKKSFYHAVRRHVRLAAVHAGKSVQATFSPPLRNCPYSVFVVAAQFMSGQLFSTAVLSDTSPIVPSELLARTNTEREAVGVSSLQLNDVFARGVLQRKRKGWKQARQSVV